MRSGNVSLKQGFRVLCSEAHQSSLAVLGVSHSVVGLEEKISRMPVCLENLTLNITVVCPKEKGYKLSIVEQNVKVCLGTMNNP